jgi:hypothetical protein
VGCEGFADQLFGVCIDLDQPELGLRQVISRT